MTETAKPKSKGNKATARRLKALDRHIQRFADLNRQAQEIIALCPAVKKCFNAQDVTTQSCEFVNVDPPELAVHLESALSFHLSEMNVIMARRIELWRIIRSSCLKIPYDELPEVAKSYTFSCVGLEGALSFMMFPRESAKTQLEQNIAMRGSPFFKH
ncbi:hypothetical protein WSS15_16930 [Acetobacter pasteurianus]|uniref:hypothetical protein n=1 Tax=Acetobacter pasteurianus TaxID=438 RepID=UPI0022C69C57|nr:hypothetical protein [Acetobacter pasteurianus]GLH29043.1 hypothetical protein WSS15_16930 [Acetobacter pasteurianus]